MQEMIFNNNKCRSRWRRKLDSRLWLNRKNRKLMKESRRSTGCNKSSLKRSRRSIVCNRSSMRGSNSNMSWSSNKSRNNKHSNLLNHKGSHHLYHLMDNLLYPMDNLLLLGDNLPSHQVPMVLHLQFHMDSLHSPMVDLLRQDHPLQEADLPHLDLLMGDHLSLLVVGHLHLVHLEEARDLLLLELQDHLHQGLLLPQLLLLLLDLHLQGLLPHQPHLLLPQHQLLLDLPQPHEDHLLPQPCREGRLDSRMRWEVGCLIQSNKGRS